ncbi:MAG: FliG C-terminal domain-containing protein, partial [bacterium]|nr:FliG C-terminal domain-containing protein [bacterium]
YVERDIRSMARRFGSVIFNKRTSTDKGVKISEAVNSFTSNPNLRADLERVFRKMSKVEILLPDVPVDTSTPPSADLIKSNVHNELVGPNLPPELATPPVGSVDFDVTNPEQRLKAANSDSFLGALMKRTEEGLNRRLKEWSGSERKVTSEAVTLEPTLEEIIAEVSDVIKSEEGKGLVLVPYEEVEEVGVDIRRMNTRFGGINFNKRPPFDKEAEIAREVNAFTSNEKLREDLLRVFRKAARIDGVVTKPAAEERTETGPAVAMPVEQLPTLPKAPTLESIITEIRSAMRKDKSLVFSVPNKEVESSIRRMGNRFGGFDFNKLSPAEKEAEILNDVNEFTLNPQWRAKLEWVFRVIAKVAKVEAGLSAKSLSATDSPDTIATVTTGGGLSQTEFDASQFPRESPFHPESYIQYDGPIGPKIPLQITDALPVGSVALEREARRKSLKFGDLGALAMKDLEKILTEAGPAVLARALISAGDIKFLDPMPESFKAELLKQIKALPKPSDADSAVAQESILEIARKLEAAGTVSFAPKAEAVLPDNTSVAASAANQAIEITPNASNQVLARAVNQGATTASAPAIENVPSAPQKKETRKEKQDRRVKELREQVHAEKKAEVRKNQSGGGKPPVRPPEVAVGAGPEDEPNTGKLELIGTETADVLARKIRPLKTVEFRGKQFEGQAVAELIVNNLAYMGTPGFRNLPPGQRIILVEGFVRDLKTIDPKVADMPFVKALEEALALQVPVRASETVQEISFERRNRLNEGDAVLWVDGDGKILSTRPEIILSFYETDGVVRAFFGESLKKGGGREQNSIRVENLRKFIEDVPENPTEPEKIPPRPIAPIMLVAELVELSPKMIVSPNEAIAKAVLEDPAGFDIGRALDVPGFDEFLIEAQKMGVVIDMADAASLKKRFEAFAFKDAAAAGTYELYAESISQDLGLSLDEEGKREVREHLERQAHVNPESVKSLVDKLKQFKELPPQIAGFERQLDELKATLTPEAQARAKQELTDKQEAFQMVLRTNKFWPGYSEEEGIAGLGRLQHLFGIFSKKSYSGAKARSELSRVPAVRSKGFEKYVTLGTGFSNEQLRTGLQLIEGQLADFGRQMETKSLGVAELEAQRALIKGMLENDKVELFRDNALTRKLVGMARVKVKEKLNSSLIYGEESVDKAVSANELFERTIRASSGNKFGDDGDYFEGVNVSDYRRLIDSTLDRGIEKEIEKSIVRSMALSTGRFGELQKSFDRLTANERLGSKSRSEVRKFIVKKLNSELGLAAGLTTDDSTDEGKKQVTEAKLKVLHLKALIVKQREALALNR